MILSIAPPVPRDVYVRPTWRGLTQRQIEITRLVARPSTDVEIANILSLSPRTVGARLFAVVTSSRDKGPGQRFRLGLVSADRMSLEPCGPGRFSPAPLLPAEVQRVLAPFQVVRGFSSDLGIREYYAVLP